MAAYISVPRDLSKVKSKLLFNLTKRQLICFGSAALLGVPTFFLLRKPIGVSAATIVMMAIMMPLFFLAMYERNGQPLEVIAKHFIETKFIRPTVRPYKTDNYYAALMRQRQAEMEVNRIVQTKAAKTHKQHPKARGSASARSHKAAEKGGTRRSGARQTR